MKKIVSGILALAGLFLLATFGLSAFAGEPTAWPAIRVDGVMARGNSSLALLNGRMLGVGEKIAGVEVVSIAGSSVTLRFEGETRTMRQGQKTDEPQPAANPPAAAPAPAPPAAAVSPAATNRTAWGDQMQQWARDNERIARGVGHGGAEAPPGVTQPVANPPAPPQVPPPAPAAVQPVAAPAGDKPRNLEAEVIAEYMQQNPGLQARLRAQQQQSMAAANALRNDPKTGPIARIFLPPRAAVKSSLQVMQDNVDSHLGYLTQIERKAGRGVLTLADVSRDDPEGFMLVPGLFLRGTLWALQREGPESALRFACGFIESYSARKAEFAGAWGTFSYEEHLASMSWMTAGAQEAAGDGAGARATLEKALAAKMAQPLVPSIRHMAARAAHRGGQDFEASEILRALVEEPTSKDLPLRLPEEVRALGSVYAESVALLETIRQASGKPSAGQKN